MNKINIDLPDTIYRSINLKLSPYSEILNSFYKLEFYDGPTYTFLSEMVMNVYDFSSC